MCVFQTQNAVKLFNLLQVYCQKPILNIQYDRTCLWGNIFHLCFIRPICTDSFPVSSLDREQQCPGIKICLAEISRITSSQPSTGVQWSAGHCRDPECDVHKCLICKCLLDEWCHQDIASFRSFTPSSASSSDTSSVTFLPKNPFRFSPRCAGQRNNGPFN